MKIIQVSDLHLGRRGEFRFGADLHERLDRCIAHINAHHGDTALCVFTGDLTETGDASSYADLKTALKALSVPYRLLPGNHDKRANLVAAFPECPIDDNGFVQSIYDTTEGLLLFLDTLAEGRVAGELCEKRLAWLDARLGARRRAVLPWFSCIIHQPNSALPNSIR
jgi:Icc protein